MDKKLILASLSIHRAQILKNAGLDVRIEAAQINEREVEKDFTLISPSNLALALSAAKAREVAARFPDDYVIGCDQILEFEGSVLHKPQNMRQAKERLQRLSGKEHALHSAISLYQGRDEIWHHVDTAHMQMRDLSEGFLISYLHHIGENVLTSVGVYQIEREGIQLFNKIEGDYFTIIGLPLLPLLCQLRALKFID